MTLCEEAKAAASLAMRGKSFQGRCFFASSIVSSEPFLATCRSCMSDPSHAPTTPLRDLFVLEFTQNVMGPSGGLVLADLGADVVKIEPVEGEATRFLGGFASGFFNYFNRNKRSLAVDLKSERGRALVHRLVAKADIVLENYAPGTMERLGCGYETLSALNPRLIYCALKGYLSGPYEKRSALDEVAQFQSGLAYMTGP